MSAAFHQSLAVQEGKPTRRRLPWVANPGRPWRRLIGFGISAGLLGVALVLASGCGSGPAPAKKPRAVEVIVTTPITDEVMDYQDFTGRLSAVKTVDIRARVSGYVIDVPFKEGDIVQEGDLLFQIDPRPYKAQYESAKALVASARAQINVSEANLKLAQVTYERARNSGSAAAPLELDQDLAQQRVSQANLTLARANLGSAEANLETAKLNFNWTTVKAPVTGRVSRRLVDPGNLVMADNTILTTIVTEDPLYAYFEVDERTYLDILALAMTNRSSWFTGLQFPVMMRLANEDTFTHVGTVDFIDNQVTATTGTVRMRGVFRMEDFKRDELKKLPKNPPASPAMGKQKEGPFRLKPGLFVRIRLPIGYPYPAILIPDEALQSDQGRKFLYVVNDKDEVEYRQVKLGQAIQGLRVVREGLKEGERVIVSGTQRVQPGKKVRPKKQPPPQAPKTSLVKQLRDFNPPAPAGAK